MVKDLNWRQRVYRDQGTLGVTEQVSQAVLKRSCGSQGWKDLLGESLPGV